MANWVKTIETNMRDCPSAEEIARMVKATGLPLLTVWRKMIAKELNNG